MADAHDPHLAHHFSSPQQQFESGKLGMWLFLATEVLFFGGLFCAYAVYRANHPDVFVHAHVHLDKKLGAFNTVVLLASSLTMAWAVRCSQLGQRRGLVLHLMLTLLLSFVFLCVKYVEYKAKWEHGLLWASQYTYHGEGHADEGDSPPLDEGTSSAPAPTPTPTPTPAPPAAADSASTATLPAPLDERTAFEERSSLPAPAAAPGGLAELDEGDEPALDSQRRTAANLHIFFKVYFGMTGLHAIHVLAGMALILWLIVRSIRGDFHPGYFLPVDLVGLYWHLVDLIWIYLFPLLYLIH